MKYFLSVLAIFKNESNCINEWIQHYLNEGVEHFYLIDNGSDDNYDISKYNRFIDLVIDATPFIQTYLYNTKYLDKIKKESIWIIVVDLDEFIYSRNSYNRISDYLVNFNEKNIGYISIPWKMYGSSKLIEQPNPGNLIKSFLYRKNYYTTSLIEAKCIISTRNLIKFDIHMHEVTNGSRNVTSNSKIANTNSAFQFIDEDILRDSILHINHYGCQSFNWFMKVKAVRGDATKDVNVRDINYFLTRDAEYNDIIDNELVRKYYFKR